MKVKGDSTGQERSAVSGKLMKKKVKKTSRDKEVLYINNYAHKTCQNCCERMSCFCMIVLYSVTRTESNCWTF